MASRTATIKRTTAETDIQITLNLDGTGDMQFSIIDSISEKMAVPFLVHMLEQLGKYSLFDISIQAKGDTYIDDHHLVEDIAITLGQAILQAVGDKKGIVRFGHAYAPLDESLSRVVIDYSGRPGLSWRVNFTRFQVGNFDTDLLREFFQALVNHAKLTMHIDNLHGNNSHHQAESIFKALGLCLRKVCSLDKQRKQEIPSTKGVL
jgi:imidazoleglycerol-phosphate dehydratase